MCVTLELTWRVRKNRFPGSFHGYHDHVALAEDRLVRQLGGASGDLMLLVEDCHADATLIDIYWRLPDSMEDVPEIAMDYARKHLVRGCAFADSLVHSQPAEELRVPA